MVHLAVSVGFSRDLGKVFLQSAIKLVVSAGKVAGWSSVEWSGKPERRVGRGSGRFHHQDGAHPIVAKM